MKIAPVCLCGIKGKMQWDRREQKVSFMDDEGNSNLELKGRRFFVYRYLYLSWNIRQAGHALCEVQLDEVSVFFNPICRNIMKTGIHECPALHSVCIFVSVLILLLSFSLNRVDTRAY
jgi:hypothetical protein